MSERALDGLDRRRGEIAEKGIRDPRVLAFRKTATTLERVEVIIAARFVPLIGEHGAIGG